MKGKGIVPLVIFALLSFCCQQEPPSEKSIEAQRKAGFEAEINLQRIEMLTGTTFKILRIETIGYSPRHKFFWVCLPEREDKAKIEGLASAIIRETIVANAAEFHSFTVHFFCELEMAATVTASRRFAQATFLPEGSWVMIERIPIDDYKDYVLNCTFFD